MADISITAANVKPGANAKKETGVAGETIAAGKAVYLSATTGKWMLADNNSATASAKVPRGIALTGSSLDQPIVVQTRGQITIGATLVPGTAYYLSDTPGGICPLADVGSGEDVALLGLASTAAILDLDIQAPGVTL